MVLVDSDLYLGSSDEGLTRADMYLLQEFATAVKTDRSRSH
jgi:hypothetical protein